MTAPDASASLLRRLPPIDYTKHPLFGRPGRRPTLGARLLGYARYAWILGYVVSLRCLHLITRRRWTEANPTPHLDALRRDGMIALRLGREARAAVTRAAQPYFEELEKRRAQGPTDRWSYYDGQLDTDRADAPDLYAAIERMLTDAGILSSVRAYVGSRAEVRKVTVQINDEHDTFWRTSFEARGLPVPDTRFFHVDNTYGVVKVILYMSEVTETTGPFSYLPGTHRIAIGPLEGVILRATDIWLDVWPAHRDLFLTLPRLLQRRAKFGDDIPPDAEWGRWLLAHERTVTSADGDMLLFDVMGIHRGGIVAAGERRIIQIMIR